MINELPDTDIIAMHFFFHFISMKEPVNFFKRGECSEDNGVYKSTLILDENGKIHENKQLEKGLSLTLTFSVKEYRRRIINSIEKYGHEKHCAEQSLVDSMYEQIPLQIYYSTLLLSTQLSSYRVKSLEELEHMTVTTKINAYQLYLKMFMPLVRITTQKKQH
jgi:hypothetical protein